MAGFDNDILYADNVDFRGVSPVVGQVTLDGQLLIGAAVAPFIRANTLTAGSGISITNSAGSITITNTGGGGGGGGTESLAGNSGSATEVGGVINVIGATNITTTGAGQTLTITPTGNLLGLAGLAGTGYVVQTGAGTFTNRTFLAGSGISLTNASGVAGATTITADANVPTTFTSDAGAATPAANNLNVLGGTGIDTTGAGSTLTVTFDVTEVATIATSYTCDAGSAVPAANVLTVTGGTGCATSGAGSTVTVNVDAAVPLTFPTDAGTATPAANALTVAGGTGCATTGAGATVTVNLDATVPLSFPADTGTATPAGNALTIAGGTGCSTTGVGSTITVNVDTNVPITFAADVGSATPAANTITLAGGTGIATSGAGSTVTFDLDGPVALTYTTDSGVAVPTANNLNIIGVAAQGISTSGAGSSVTVTATNATYVSKGVASFDMGDFTVVAGAVSLNAAGVGQTITGDSGGALSPTLSNWNLLGSGSITTAGSGSTLTTQLTGLTNHAVLVGAGTTTITKVGPSATAGQILQSQGASADPAFSTATYPSTSGASGNVLTSDGTNWLSAAPAAAAPISNSTINFADDIICAATINPLLNQGGNAGNWRMFANGIGSSLYTAPGGVGEVNHPGIFYMSTGTTASNYCIASLGQNFLIGGGAIVATLYFKLPTLSSAGSRYLAVAGMGDGSSTGGTGCYVTYTDNVNTGRWVYRCANGGVMTTTNSTTAVTAGWQVIQITVNAAGTSVSFSAGTTLAGIASLGAAITTNLPADMIGAYFRINYTAGTTGVMIPDLVTISQTLTTAR